jgi:hypothetical protein
MAVHDFIGRSFIPLNPTVPHVIEHGKQPSEWVELLAEKGITISERSLREKANKLGARIKLGRTMLITVGHMELILKEGEKCRSNRTSEAPNGGRKVESRTKAGPSQTTTRKALELYQSKVRGSGAGKKKQG